jgi:hypothetical protein
MSAVAARLVLGFLVALGASGCGQDIVALDQISGAKVAAMAERGLEAENPRMAPGTLSCPDLDFRAGAEVRCLRTTKLSGGRLVRVSGVIRVASISSGGRLHVSMDDDATGFGVAGAHLAADVSNRYRKRYGVRPSRVRCPDLRGALGAAVTCRVEVGAKRQDLDVVVTKVDPRSYTTTYVTRAHRGDS